MSATKTPIRMITLALLAAAGCNHSSDNPPPPQGKGKEPGEIAVQKAMFQPDARLAQPFLEATISEPPEGQLLPPLTTASGKSVGKIFEQISGKSGVGGLWDNISFYTTAGKRQQYSAKIDTDLGPITIELWPEVAPNHVRNFIALAKAGYYDGLSFDRIINQPGSETQDKFELIAGGCPLGTGESGYGSIGYWMKPELNEKITHEPGTVGAWHGGMPESAACKFYITLCKAPSMDGYWTAFGKVTSGLEVARKVLDRPRREGFDDRPAEPVIIRKVTIETRSGDVS